MAQPPLKVYVDYDARVGKDTVRRTKTFLDAYAARVFYTAKFRIGKNPKVRCHR